MTTLPKHLFVSSDVDGALHDTRMQDWHKAPIRPNYCRTHREIKSCADFKATLRAGAYAWPGGYPLYFITHDGQPLCFTCARSEFRQVAWDFLQRHGTGWQVVACDVNWEDADCTCCHCNKPIPSAYR